MALRIVTYNFLAGGSKKRCSHWNEMRNRAAPDILLTQECRPEPAEPSPRATALWSEAVRGRWGSGVWARDVKIHPMEVTGFGGWVVGGEIERTAPRRTRPLRIFSVHCPAGNHGYVRTMHSVLDALKPIAKQADLILGGDFNVVVGFRGPNEPVRMSKAEKDLLDRIVGEFALIPCWQTANPERPLAQTLRWTGNRAAPYHCDGIFIPTQWRARLESCTVLSGPEWDVLSDHNPVMAVLRCSL